MTPYRLRPATTDDIDFLGDVVIEATKGRRRWTSHLDESKFRAEFARWTADQIASAEPDTSTSVVECDGERIGRLRVTRNSLSIELAGIQLRPDRQGAGIGTAIVRALQAEARATRRIVRLNVEKDNPRARELYLRLGFIPVGESEDEYQMQWTPES